MTRLAIITALLLATGCSRQGGDNEAKPNSATSAKVSPQVYGVESGTVVLESTTTVPFFAGKNAVSKTVETRRFTDWGRHEIHESETTQTNPTTKTTTTTKHTYIYDGLLQISLDHEKQTGDQTLLQTRTGVTIDMDSLIQAEGKQGAKKYLERHGMELLPDEEVAGVLCQVIRGKAGKNNETVMWSHKGILLKTETRVKLKSSGNWRVNTSTTATSFKHGVAHPPEVFAVPKGFKLSAPMTQQERMKAAQDALRQLR